jgi:hypothetical protein
VIFAAAGFSPAVAAEVAAGGVVLGGFWLIQVDLPDGGTVALGHALAIAFAVILPPAKFAAVTMAGLALALPLWTVRAGVRIRLPGSSRAGLGSITRAALRILLAATAAAGIRAVLELSGVRHAWPQGEVGWLLRALGVGIAYLAVELPSWRVRGQRSPSDTVVDIWDAARVYAALLCSAALLVVAYKARGVPAALLVAVPLLVTKVSFSRYAEARKVFDQTVRALGVLPEVSALTPLGHGERSAQYAAALADHYSFDARRAQKVITAARLHHIGLAFEESLHDDDSHTHADIASGIDVWDASHDPGVGVAGAEVLRETGFLADVADLVQAGASPGGGGVDAAIVRVASSFDDLIERYDDDTDGASLALLCAWPSAPERSVALALLQCCATNPDLVTDARERARLTSTR